MRRLLAALALLVAALVAAGGTASAPTYARAQDLTLFRIGTGGAGGTYYPIGSLIAQALSNPPGSPPCDQGGSCGVENLIGVAQSSNGSVVNVENIAEGVIESGFAQSDISYWAYSGTGIFEHKKRVENLRAIANLYPESIHLVVRRGSGIRSVADLAGKRVSHDEPGSGTLVEARIILEAYGLSVATLSGNAQWITRAELHEELVYQITKTLWHDTTTRLLHGGHANGLQIAKENALAGVSVPLHPGAERYYREAGLLP